MSRLPEGLGATPASAPSPALLRRGLKVNTEPAGGEACRCALACRRPPVVAGGEHVTPRLDRPATSSGLVGGSAISRAWSVSGVARRPAVWRSRRASPATRRDQEPAALVEGHSARRAADQAGKRRRSRAEVATDRVRSRPHRRSSRSSCPGPARVSRAQVARGTAGNWAAASSSTLGSPIVASFGQLAAARPRGRQGRCAGRPRCGRSGALARS